MDLLQAPPVSGSYEFLNHLKPIARRGRVLGVYQKYMTNTSIFGTVKRIKTALHWEVTELTWSHVSLFLKLFFSPHFSSHPT